MVVSEKVGNGVWMGSIFPDGLVMMGIWFIWFPVIEAWKGATIFKSVFQLKVVHEDGSSATLFGTLLRHMFDPIDLLLFFGIIGIALAKFTKKHQRLGDIVGQTYVTTKRHANEIVPLLVVIHMAAGLVTFLFRPLVDLPHSWKPLRQWLQLIRSSSDIL